MTNLIARSAEPTPAAGSLHPFGLGVGIHLDTSVDSTRVDAATVGHLRGLGVQRFRMNVRWDTVARGIDADPDETVLDGLEAAVVELLEAGIEPMIALDNVSLPTELEADGGWHNDATRWAFGDFAGAVGARLGHLVDEWVTFAAAQPRNFAPSMLTTLMAAQSDAAAILRAHAPQARLGASVDIAQLEPTSAADADAARTWIDHLASPRAAVEFIALNVDQPGSRAAAQVAAVVRSLHGDLPGRSFVLTEAHATVQGSSRSGRLIDLDGPERFSVVEEFLAQIRELRTQGIDVNGTFVWPFAKPTASPAAMSDVTIEGYRRILAADAI